MPALQSRESPASEGGLYPWRLGRVLFGKRHAVPIMLALYKESESSTSGLITRLKGHPAAIIETLRLLEGLGVLSRTRKTDGRHRVEARLTPYGRKLMETPLCLWSLALEEKVTLA